MPGSVELDLARRYGGKVRSGTATTCRFLLEAPPLGYVVLRGAGHRGKLWIFAWPEAGQAPLWIGSKRIRSVAGGCKRGLPPPWLAAGRRSNDATNPAGGRQFDGQGTQVSASTHLFPHDCDRTCRSAADVRCASGASPIFAAVEGHHRRPGWRVHALL